VKSRYIVLIAILFVLSVGGQAQQQQATIETSQPGDTSCASAQLNSLHLASQATTLDEANLDLANAQAYGELVELHQTC